MECTCIIVVDALQMRDDDNDDDSNDGDDDGMSTITTKVLQDVVYSCQAVNEAGSSSIESCSVTAIQQGTRLYYCHVTSVSLLSF